MATKIEKNDELEQKGPEIQVVADGSHVQSSEKFLIFLEEKKWYIVAVVAAVAIIIGGFYFYRSHKAKQEDRASLELSRIRPYMDAGDYQKALDGDPNAQVRGDQILGLRQIVSEYSSTNAGKTAALLCGQALLKTNKFDEALEMFDKANGSDSPLIQAAAYAGAGASEEMKNDFNKAAESYEKAAKLGEDVGAQEKYTFFEGLCYEKAGNKDKAITLYKEVVNLNESSEYAGQAKAGLTRLGTIIE